MEVPLPLGFVQLSKIMNLLQPLLARIKIDVSVVFGNWCGTFSKFVTVSRLYWGYSCSYL